MNGKAFLLFNIIGGMDPFISFYKNPNASTYKAAMDHYIKEYEEYQNEKFPISDDLSFTERIKHIR